MKYSKPIFVNVEMSEEAKKLLDFKLTAECQVEAENAEDWRAQRLAKSE